MPSPSRVFRIIPIMLACLTAPAWSRVPERVEHAAPAIAAQIAARTGSPARQIALARAPSWLAFQRRHGDWRATWNEATATPHRAFGRGIPLAGFSGDAAGLDRAVRGFVAEHPDLFAGVPDLELAGAHRARGVWYVRYRQEIHGTPVLFSDWEFRVAADGRLMMFGADAHRADAVSAVRPAIDGAAARAAAVEGLAFDPATDRIEGGERLYYVPALRDGRDVLRLAYEVNVRVTNPRAAWLTLVDAVDGSVLYRQDRIRHALVQGTVTGQIHPNLPTDARITVPFENAWVTVGAGMDTTDATGHYERDVAGMVTVASQMSGPYVRVLRQDGGTGANFSKSVTAPITENIAWTTGNSLDSERDAFYHANLTRDYILGFDPGYTANDAQIDAKVNFLDDECAAWWDYADNSLNFTSAGAYCPNTATVPEIVSHEYFHSVMDRLYFQQGAPFGMVNSALHEGLADAMVGLMTDDPLIGDGFEGPGSWLRDISVVRRWPEDATPSSHETGLILAGALWDLRQAIGLSAVRQLSHFALYGLADDPDPGTAMSEYFIEMLVADDDDANLSNGTPNFGNIVSIFNDHGIGTAFFINIQHTVLDDQSTNGPYPITAQVQYTGPFGSLASVTLFYSVNGLPYASQPMTPTGNPDEWGGEVPATSGAIVNYYIASTESNGGGAEEPQGAPDRDHHVFVAGPAFPLLLVDMEIDPGWTIGAAGDNATSGFWVHADPVGTVAQPEDDHTPVGSLCFVTGNANPGDFPGVNDVDGGRTTLLSSIFDATGWADPIISYWRWFSNNTGDSPNEDPWRVAISNNGGTSWVTVENTMASELGWRRVVFFIEDYLAPTNNMRMRFAATDTLGGSLVEAAVDDWALLAFTPGVDVPGRPAPRSLWLAPASPNPFRDGTQIRYTLPAAGRIAIDVFDIHGRMIRRIAGGMQAAGTHAARWDGRDDGGRPVSSGPYFVRLAHDGRTVSQAVVRVR